MVIPGVGADICALVGCLLRFFGMFLIYKIVICSLFVIHAVVFHASDSCLFAQLLEEQSRMIQMNEHCTKVCKY